MSLMEDVWASSNDGYKTELLDQASRRARDVDEAVRDLRVKEWQNLCSGGVE